MNAINQQQIGNAALEPTIMALYQLSPSSQGAVAALVRHLAEREGIEVPLTIIPPLFRFAADYLIIAMYDS